MYMHDSLFPLLIMKAWGLCGRQEVPTGQLPTLEAARKNRSPVLDTYTEMQRSWEAWDSAKTLASDMLSIMLHGQAPSTFTWTDRLAKDRLPDLPYGPPIWGAIHRGIQSCCCYLLWHSTILFGNPFSAMHRRCRKPGADRCRKCRCFDRFCMTGRYR